MAYTIKVKEFEGPLEILLELIEARELSINEVSLAAVTQDYFIYLKNLETRVEEKKIAYRELASFLLVASALILIKSKSLLPGFTITQEEKEDIRELEERLIKYKRIREAAGILAGRVQKRTPIFSRAPYVGLPMQFSPPPLFSLEELPKILENLLSAIPQLKALKKEEIKKVISIEERIRDLEARIREGIASSFAEFVKGKSEKIEIIVSFLAMLELIKHGVLAAEQDFPFGSIVMRKHA